MKAIGSLISPVAMTPIPLRHLHNSCIILLRNLILIVSQFQGNFLPLLTWLMYFLPLSGLDGILMFTRTMKKQLPKQGILTKDYFTLSMVDRKSTRLNSSHLGISYAVFCL